MADELRGVTFDWWGTLYRHRNASGTRVDLIRRAAARGGMNLNEEEVAAAYSNAAAEFDRSWRAGQAYSTEAWLHDILAELGIELPAVEATALLSAMEEAILERPPVMVEGAGDLLCDLHEAGVRLGLISDTGLTVGRVMRRILERDQVLHCFQGWAFSDEVGAFKPDRRPFEAALTGMEVPAHRAIHVGDLPFTDIWGAKAMGMRAVLISGESDLPDEEGLADAVVTDYAQLRHLFGEWGILPAD